MINLFYHIIYFQQIYRQDATKLDVFFYILINFNKINYKITKQQIEKMNENNTRL